mgnify:FL=1
MAEPWSGEERLFWLFYLIRKVAFGCRRKLTLRINRDNM